MDSEEDIRSILIAQYQRCSEDWRFFDDLFWKLPFGTVTVVILSLSFLFSSEDLPPLGRIPLILGVMLLTIVVAILCFKIRLASSGRVKVANFIETRLGVDPVPIITEDLVKYLDWKSKFYSISAYKSQMGLYFALIVIELCFILRELFPDIFSNIINILVLGLIVLIAFLIPLILPQMN
ncbi:MAG: hypothetical protein QCI00_09635 [Candidatus Thermoplasmatota archaeon]|nr:hypothetical protein [Candidatus Thermoplasmatota archaeon]